MQIFLTGFMGAGKTTVGRILAAECGREFIDLDERIEERVGRTIPEIFSIEGEAWFRRAEHEALVSIRSPRVVIATGGGTAVFEGNRRWMARHGVVAWLHPPLATILERIGAWGKDDRPLFANEEQVRDLYRSRLPAYRQADLVVEVGSDETPAQVAARLRLLIFSEETCGI